MATVTLKIHVFAWTADELRQAVRDVDALDDAIPIAFESVTAKDVLQYMLSGTIGLDFEVLEDSLE